MNKKTKIGRLGEFLALRYLKQKNFDIVDLNWRYRHLEIDLIASFDKRLVFFEIKTRTDKFSFPEENFKLKQAKNLRRAIKAYCDINRINVENIDFYLLFIFIDETNKRAKVICLKEALF